MLSKSRIDKIGNLLKNSTSLEKSEYQALLQWRNSFSSTLDYYHIKLKEKIDPAEVKNISRRFKRIDSIHVKLKRFKTMRLSTLQDIAGLRVVLADELALQKAFTKLRGLPSKHELKKVDNYYAHPKQDGYRGIHLIYQSEKSTLVEVQLRTELQHIWATAVEIYGALQNTSFKTGDGEQSWKEFFSYLSSYFAIKENSSPLTDHIKLSEKKIKSKLIKLIKKLNVIERLNASTNSIQVITNKFNQTGKSGKYALIELDLKKQTTTVEFFTKKDLTKAIEIYTRKELAQDNNHFKNIVLVNIDDIKKIQQSYPNYFMNTKSLLELLAKITLNEF